MITFPTLRGVISQFSPLLLGPKIWLSDTGSNPGTWYDISGNNRHATQTATANQPSIVTNALNGRQVRRFDGNRGLRISDSNAIDLDDFTIFIVAKITNYASIGQNVLLCKGDLVVPTGDLTGIAPPAYEIRLSAPSGTKKWSAAVSSGTGSYAQSQSDYVDETPTILTAYRAKPAATIPEGVTLAKNGADALASAAIGTLRNTTTPLGIGCAGTGTISAANLCWQGDIAEVLVFGRNLSGVNRYRVEKYLSKKYNIPTI